MPLPTPDLPTIRRLYAEDVCFPFDNPRLIDAFATVPREAFLKPGPWLIQNRHTAPHYLPTKDADPRHLYHDAHIALDASGFINSGGPGFNAFLLNLLEVQPGETVVYLGCGCGYYAGIMAELVGPRGKVIAMDCDPARAAQAGKALAPWPQGEALCANGATEDLEPADVIIASAGVTHPPANWLAALKIGGRLIFPLMGTMDAEQWGSAAVLFAERQGEGVFAVRRLCDAAFLEFVGARSADLAARIDWQLGSDRGAGIRSLRCDSHPEDAGACWLHGDHFCLSRIAPQELICGAGEGAWSDTGTGLNCCGPFNSLNVLPYGRPAR